MTTKTGEAVIPDNDDDFEPDLTESEREAIKLGPEIDAEVDFADGAIEREGGKQPEQRVDSEKAIAEAQAAAEAEAAAKAGSEGGADADAGDKGAADAVVQQPQQPQQPAAIDPSTFQVDVPVDVKAKLDDVEGKIKALRATWRQGDLEADAYDDQLEALQAEREKIRDDIQAARIAAQFQQRAAQQMWQAAIDRFYARNPELDPANHLQKAALNIAIKQADREAAGKGMSDDQILDEGLRLWREANGVKAPARQPAQRKTLEEANLPPNLGSLPASAQPDVRGDKFAWLERLDGPARDDALAKMSPAELAEYERWG